MLIALLVTYLLGSNSLFGSQLTTDDIDVIQERIEIIVEDPGIISASEDILDLAEDELKGFEKLFKKSGKVLTKQYKDHEDTTAAMLAELNNLNSDWEAAQSQLLDKRFALKAQLTQEQWEKIFEQ